MFCRKEADREYLVRRERLKSEIEKSRSGSNNRELDVLAQELDTFTGDRPGPRELLVVHKAEAELCLVKPVSLLYPTYLRLRSRFYRFDQDRRIAWEADLKRLLPDESIVSQEDVLRQRLCHLTYELSEEAESYNRLSQEKSRVVRNLTIAGIILLIVLLIAEIFAVHGLPPSPWLFDQLLIPGLVAGALGSITSATSSIGDESARRDEFLWTLLSQLALRTLLGAVYALLVLTAVFSQLLPIAIPKSDASLYFVLAFGFAAGFSDKFFGQTVRLAS